MKNKEAQAIYEWIEAVIFSLAVVVIIFTFVFRIIGVSGISMENTLNKGVIREDQSVDRVLVSHINYEPKQGDIIVIWSTALDENIIKRVIAVGGDTVNIDFNKHSVSVNGKVLNEPYIKEPTTEQGDVVFPAKVPAGHVFVMGDNRNNSHDSRYSDIGMVDDHYILGKAYLRIYPLDEIKIL